MRQEGGGKKVRLRRRNEASSIAALLGRSFSPAAKKNILLSHVAQRWEEVVGKTLAKKSQPFALEGTQLCIRAESPIAAQRLSMMGAIVAKKVRDGWDLPVCEVKVIVGNVRQKTIKTAQRKREYISPRTEDISKNLERVKDRIDDPDIALSLASLMATWSRRFGQKNKR